MKYVAAFLLLAACTKKETPAVDASVADDAAIVQLIDDDGGDSAVAPLAATSASAAPTHLAAATAHPSTASTVSEPEPAMPAGECCCEVALGAYIEVPQRECARRDHGQCVKKLHCAFSRGKVRPSDRQCCCRIDDKQDIISEAVCHENGLGGRCVRMSECTR